MEAKILYISDYKRRKGLMGIKLNYGQLNSADFNQSLMLLSAQQGFASMQATNRIDDLLMDYESKMILTIHDELVFEIKFGEEHLIDEIKKIMETEYERCFSNGRETSCFKT
jgi:hypothetical protein